MQNQETSLSPESRPLVVQRAVQITNLPPQGLVYPRQELAAQNVVSKYPPLIIEDETKNYVDGIIDDDDSDGEPSSKRSYEERQKKTRGRVKIKMEFIQNKLRRYTTFSKRKTGIMKKAYELSTLTGTQVMLLVASETGHVYTFATRKLQPMITSESGKALIQTCLNSPDPTPLLAQFAPKENPSDQRMSQTGYEEPDLQYSAGDDDVKPQNAESVPSALGGINFSQGGQGIATYLSTSTAQDDQQTQTHPPMTKTPSSQPVTLHTVPGGNVTAIIAPTGSLSTGGAQTIQVHPHTVQPQILQGQLQMHKIHPQNILLSGNMSSLPSGHIIVNPNQVGSQVVIANGSQVQNASSIPVSSTSHSNENIIIVPSGGAELPGGAIQMLYNTPNGLVYASPASVIHSHTQAGSVSGSETLNIHHQPVVQTAGSYQIQQDSNQQSATTTVLQTS